MVFGGKLDVRVPACEGGKKEAASTYGLMARGGDQWRIPAFEGGRRAAARTYVVMIWGGGPGPVHRDSYIWRRQERSGPHVRVNGLVRRPEELYVGIPALEGSRREAART